jgi:hypothetical protein
LTRKSIPPKVESARAAQLLRDGLSAFLVDVGDHHAGALAMERPHHPRADEGGSAGDNGDLFFESLHAAPLPQRGFSISSG